MKILKFNESYSTKEESKLIDFYNDYIKILNSDYTKYETIIEIGQIINKFGLSKEDVKYILDNYDISDDINHFLQYEYDDWNKFDDMEKEIYNELFNIISKFDINKDKEKIIKILKSKFDISKK